MLKKVLVSLVVALKVGLMGLAIKTVVADLPREPEMRADCPLCDPPPDCFPGDPCADCG